MQRVIIAFLLATTLGLLALVITTPSPITRLDPAVSFRECLDACGGNEELILYDGWDGYCECRE